MVFLANSQEVEALSLEHLAVELEEPRREVAALAEDGRQVVLALDELELGLGVAHAPGAGLVREQRSPGLAPERRRAALARRRLEEDVRDLGLRAPGQKTRDEAAARLERARAPGVRAVSRRRRDGVAVEGRVAPLEGDHREDAQDAALEARLPELRGADASVSRETCTKFVEVRRAPEKHLREGAAGLRRHDVEPVVVAVPGEGVREDVGHAPGAALRRRPALHPEGAACLLGVHHVLDLVLIGRHGRLRARRLVGGLGATASSRSSPLDGVRAVSKFAREALVSRCVRVEEEAAGSWT